MSSIYSYPFIEETVKRKEILKASTSKEIVISINTQHAFAQELINIDAEAYNGICPTATGILL